MASIGAEQRAYMMRSIREAIAIYYGERVLSIENFKKSKRRTFIEKLEERLGANQWRKVLSELREASGRKQAALTVIKNNYSLKVEEMRVTHRQELEKLNADHALAASKLELEYRPKIEEAKQAVDLAEQEYKAKRRESYFAGLGIQDDGSNYDTYREPGFDDAVTRSVDSFMDTNLASDEEGKLVLQRTQEEKLSSDLVQISGDMADLRERVLLFIKQGKLPPFTFEAWFIIDGKDAKE